MYTPLTPPGAAKIVSNENGTTAAQTVFKTPTKTPFSHKNTFVPETPISASIVPETPPKTTKPPLAATRGVKTKLFVAANKNPNIVETPKGRMQDRAHVGGLKCDCFGRGQICRICSKKRELIAPRAGTAGFRAPEVLLKYLDQTTAIDIWSAGAIMASLLSGRYPFFRNADDWMAIAEIITLLGSKRMIKAARSLGRTLTLSAKSKRPPLDIKQLCASLRGEKPLPIPDSAFHLLMLMLDPDPRTRIRATDALNHDFFKEQDLELMTEDESSKSPIDYSRFEDMMREPLGVGMPKVDTAQFVASIKQKLMQKLELNGCAVAAH